MIIETFLYLANMVYWLTGLSGAGKTTIGCSLYYKLKEEKPNVILLDGDVMSTFLVNYSGYEYDDRKRRAYVYSNMCKMLSDQGIDVICCSISMIDEIRDWNRKNIKMYYEIFIDVPLDVLKSRDNKALYSKFRDGQDKNVVGLGMTTEFPKNPDLTILNDGKKSVLECVDLVMQNTPKEKSFYGQRKNYWNNFYSNKSAVNSPTLFAQYVLPMLKKQGSLIELGCGNGRDALFFQSNGINVTVVDGSESALDIIKKQSKNIICYFDNFVDAKIIFARQYDYFYSRFSLHSIDDAQQEILIKKIYAALKPLGKLFIEARSVNDTIYGKGEKVGRNAFFFEEHYRRFIVLEELEKALIDCHFEILYSDENQGFAPFKSDDPRVIRIIAQKNL
jgi:adenylylsulfate kinase-like enzyme/SAM-dependent methyltransferase